MEEMWKWLLDTANNAAKAIPLSGSLGAERSDLVGNIMYKLCLDQDFAKKIYKQKSYGLLYTMLRKEIYELESSLLFSSKKELSCYQRIIDICKKYDIDAKPENAYKISALMEKGTGDFTIAKVKSLLSVDCPIQYGYGGLEQKIINNNDMEG